MAVTAYLEAARVLRSNVRAFALLTLDRLLREAWDGEDALQHVIAYPDGRTRSGAALRARSTIMRSRACVCRWMAGARRDELLQGSRDAGRCHDRAVLRSRRGSILRCAARAGGHVRWAR